MIIRLCFTWKLEAYDYTSKLFNLLNEFFSIYIIPFFEGVTIEKHRKIIRESKHLNKLLYDNTTGLYLFLRIIKKIINLQNIRLDHCSLVFIMQIIN